MPRHSLLKEIAIALCLLVPAVTAAHSQSSDKDVAEIRAYVLTMDNVLRTYKAMYEIKQAAAKDPNLQKQMNADSNDDAGSQTLTAITAKYSAYPTLVAVVANNGFTPRQFVVSELALVQAGLAAAALKAGAPREKLIADSGISAANLDFVTQHQAELDELGKKYPVQ